MSYRAQALVEMMRFHIDGTKLTRLEKCILDRIAHRHDTTEGYAQVGTGYLMDQALCSDASAKRAVRSCIEHLTLMVERRKLAGRRGREYNQDNMYWFTELEILDGTARGREFTAKHGRGLTDGRGVTMNPPLGVTVNPPTGVTVTWGHRDLGSQLRTHPGVMGEPQKQLQPKASTPPPTPSSVAEGVVAPSRDEKAEKPTYFRAAGALIEVFSGRVKRIITQRQLQSMAGSRPQDYVAFFERNGFKARIVPPEELERKSA